MFATGSAAGEVGGLRAADLNYPIISPNMMPQISDFLDMADLSLNGVAMRYYNDSGFKLGAFTHPDRAVRKPRPISLQGITTLVPKWAEKL